MQTVIPRLVGRSIAHPWRTLLAVLVLVAISLVVAATRFDMTTDTAELISPNVPWRQQERTTEAAFPQLTDTMLIVVDGATPELAESAAAQLAATLSKDHAHFRSVTRPDGGEFFAREGLLFAGRAQVSRATADLIRAQPLLGPLAADPSLRGIAGSLSTMLDGVARGETKLDRIAPAMRALTRTINLSLANKPAYFSWQRLFAGNDPALAPPARRLVLTQPVLDHADLEAGSAARAQLWQAVRALGLTETHGVRVRVTGEVPLADEEFATLKENIGLVGFVMFIAMITTLWLATRSAKLLAAILITTIAGLIVTTAVGLLAVGRLNLISIAFIPLFVGLGVDFGIQLSVRFNAERREGTAVSEALSRAAVALGPSLLLAASAVFLGFAAFLPTAYVGISELGIIAALGMAIALALSVTLLPALVVLFAPAPPARPMAFAGLATADNALATHRRSVLIAFGVSLAISIALLPWVKFDFNPLHLRDPEAPAMATLADLTRDPDRTPNTIDVLAPDHAAAAALSKRLSALPEVRQVVSIDSFVPADQTAKLAMIGDASTLLDLTINPFDEAPAPTDAELVAALFSAADKLLTASRTGEPGSADALALANAFERLATATPAQRQAVNTTLAKPLGVMLDQIRASLQAASISRATLPPALVRDWVAPDGRERLQVFPAGNANDNHTIHRFRDAVARVTPAISGLPVATQAAAATVSRAFVQAGIIAFMLVSILLFVVLRDAREVAFTLAPVILSIFLTLGTCVLIAQPLNFANIIAFPLLFGVGVAFHIYFVMAWRGGTRNLLQSSLARAVLFSALATGTAFGSLWLSAHPGTASMGKILMISLIWTLICALIFEPALLGPPLPGRRAGPAAPTH